MPIPKLETVIGLDIWKKRSTFFFVKDILYFQLKTKTSYLQKTHAIKEKETQKNRLKPKGAHYDKYNKSFYLIFLIFIKLQGALQVCALLRCIWCIGIIIKKSRETFCVSCIYVCEERGEQRKVRLTMVQ